MHLSNENNYWGTGVSFFDYNDDGFDDLTICDSPFGVRVFRSNGDSTFTNTLTFNETGLAECPTWVDYDNDSDYDLFYTCDLCLSKLFRNDGNDTYTDVTLSLNPELKFAKSRGCSWGDYDNSKNRIMEAKDVADIIMAATNLSAAAVIEDIVLRPQLGDL